jgi:hypothetical protein
LDTDAYNTELIELLATQEEKVAALYTTFARQFPSHRAFWTDLAREETLHAQWLRRLYARTQTGTGRIRSDHLDVTSIRESVDKLQDLQQRVEKVPPDLVEALRMAQRIESTVCESHYFEIFEGLSEWAEFKQVQYCLAEATRHHVETIHAFLAEVEKR